jgi:hypothetical protein
MRGLIILLLFSMLICGCGPRQVLSIDETTRNYSITHQLKQRMAYDATEVWIAQTFVSAKNVIDVRQPENGLLIGKTILAITQTTGIAAMSARYDVTIKVINTDNAAAVVCSINQFGGTEVAGTHDEMNELLNGVDCLVDQLAVSIGGAVSSRPAPLRFIN